MQDLTLSSFTRPDP